MYKIYSVLFFILVSNSSVLCMESKDTAPKPIENLWQSRFDGNKISNEFLGDELIGIMKSAIQFICSVDDLNEARKKTSGKDSASSLGKEVLSASLFNNIRDVIDKMFALYGSLFELENENPVIAQTLHIKSSFSLSFRQTVGNVIRTERSCLPFADARIKLINSMKRLQHLTEYISKRISSVKDSENHLKVLGLLKSIALTFQKEISLRKTTFRSKLRSDLPYKLYKRGKIQKLVIPKELLIIALN